MDLENLKIAGCYKPRNYKDTVSVEFHHFSDTSIKEYGQCSYLRLTLRPLSHWKLISKLISKEKFPNFSFERALFTLEINF